METFLSVASCAEKKITSGAWKVICISDHLCAMLPEVLLGIDRNCVVDCHARKKLRATALDYQLQKNTNGQSN